MQCTNPITAYWSLENSNKGRKLVTFDHSRSNKQKILLPCRKCISCKLAHARDWVIRMQHESMMHEDNCFITLTYNDESMPQNGSLRYIDFQKFIKAIRQKTGLKLRYYVCGEYGENPMPAYGSTDELPGYGRPHWHAIIFGYDPKDKTLWREGKNKIYRSKEVEKCWWQGHSEIGNVSYGSISYTANYVLKQTGHYKSELEYSRVHPFTGDLIPIEPEHAHMSTNPAIGKTWYDKYAQTDLWPNDFTVIDGKKYRVPDYYGKLLRDADPDRYVEIKFARRKALKKTKSTPNQLALKNQAALLNQERKQQERKL